jgi:hypothetical protein
MTRAHTQADSGHSERKRWASLPNERTAGEGGGSSARKSSTNSSQSPSGTQPTVSVRTSVGHGEHEGVRVCQLKVLVVELASVDTLATGAVVSREVSTLQHEPLDAAMEERTFVVERLAALLAQPFLPGAERTKVLRGLRYSTGKQLKDYSTRYTAQDIAVRCESIVVCVCVCVCDVTARARPK